MEKGGAAERLAIQIGQNARTIYTYTGSQALLTDASNAFVTGNNAITNPMLGVSTVSDREKLFDIVRKDSFGDVIHSEPAVVFYSSGADGNPDTSDDTLKSSSAPTTANCTASMTPPAMRSGALFRRTRSGGFGA